MMIDREILKGIPELTDDLEVIKKRFLADLTVEERLRGIPPEELIQALPPQDLERLRALLDKRN